MRNQVNDRSVGVVHAMFGCVHIQTFQRTHILREKESSSVYITELNSILLCNIALGVHLLDGVFLECYYDVCLPQDTL